MLDRISQILDWISDFIAGRKGLLLILAILCVIINYLLKFFPGVGFVADTDLLLHIGTFLGFLGVLLAWAL
ncbi:MAG: hypothetical protein JXA19_00155 [Anaerolineales bacterium]|nr:hypothetical protein [Anaerolineales bacterium]